MLVKGLAENSLALAVIKAGVVTEQEILAAPQRAASPIAMLGVAFDKVTLHDAVGRIAEMIASRQPHYVATANVDFLVQAREDLELQRILLNAPLVLCDGTPLVWASRLLGNPLPERVAGADLVPELISLAAKKNYRLFFLGTTEDANARALARLHRQFPHLKISHYSPPFRPLLEMDDAEIIRRIRASAPDLLFVAFGCPKAEKWIAMHYRELGVPVCIGVGATIDFLAGNVKRAPRWMQRGGVEWIFRLCQEPRRLFKRYATDLWHFGGAIFQQWRKMKSPVRARREVVRSKITRSERIWVRVEASRCLNRDSIERDAELWKEIGQGMRHCLVEAGGVHSVDSTGVAALVHLQKQLRARERELILLAPSAELRSAIKTMRLESFFAIKPDFVQARRLINARMQEQLAAVAGNDETPLIWRGEITIKNAEQIGQRTWAVLNSAGSNGKPWMIDLAEVRFMDSGGVKMLLRTVELARRAGIRLCFSNPSAPVRSVLRISKAEQVLEIAA